MSKVFKDLLLLNVSLIPRGCHTRAFKVIDLNPPASGQSKLQINITMWRKGQLCKIPVDAFNERLPCIILGIQRFANANKEDYVKYSGNKQGSEDRHVSAWPFNTTVCRHYTLLSILGVWCLLQCSLVEFTTLGHIATHRKKYTSWYRLPELRNPTSTDHSVRTKPFHMY